jgi:chromosome segregation ATPase
MMVTWKFMALLVALPTLLIAGCATSPGAPGTVTETEGGPATKRFQDTPLDGRTAVESAIELSEKYATLSDQAATLREENQQLAAENERLREQVTSLEARLKQTQKELTEANDLLIEMLTELNNWKSNILGFRNEMREAAKAQLEALLKVLEILGGEVEAGLLEPRQAGMGNSDTNDAAQPDGGSSPQESNPDELP